MSVRYSKDLDTVLAAVFVIKSTQLRVKTYVSHTCDSTQLSKSRRTHEYPYGPQTSSVDYLNVFNTSGCDGQVVQYSPAAKTFWAASSSGSGIGPIKSTSFFSKTA